VVSIPRGGRSDIGRKIGGTLYWYPKKRILVKVDPYLVRCAQEWEEENLTGVRGFISTASVSLFLIGGILGAGIAYAYYSRTPKKGQPTMVFPESGPCYTGKWQGIDEDGDMVVGNRVFDPDDVLLAGPRRTGGGRHDPFVYVDMNAGFIHPEVLAELKRKHNRNGYERRKR